MQLTANMTLKTSELKDRINEKKHELLATLSRTKADTKGDAGDLRDKTERKLRQLDDYLKDGWDKMTDQVSAKLNDWLKD